MGCFDNILLLASSLENETTNQIRDYIQWKVDYTKETFHLPPQSITKLNSLLEDDTISLDEFTKQLEIVFNQYNSLWWQTWLWVLNLIEKIQGPILFGLIFTIVMFFVVILTDLRFIIIKPLQVLTAFLKACTERILAAIWYWFPFMEMFVVYAPTLMLSSTLVRQYCPGFMGDLAQLYYLVPDSFSNVYFFGLIWLVTKTSIIRSRFIRFHMMRSLMINTFSNLAAHFFYAVQRAADRGQCSQEKVAIVGFYCFAIVMSWILPAIIQALTKTYPQSWLVREAVEVLLGRDTDDPNFEWWDRKKDKK
jgi:hypothetical protein